MFKAPAVIMDNPNTETTLSPSVLIPNMERLPALEIDICQLLYKVVTPYVLEAWRQALLDAGILRNYPNLVHDLEFGSPIGNPPPIDFTFIPKNLPSAEINPEYITNLILEEV